LHGGEVNELVLQNFVGRLRIVNHPPIGVVPDNRRAAQPLQDADLDFLRAERDEPVKAGGKAFDDFARQTDDQIGVDVNAGFAAEEMEIGRELFVILPTLDQAADFRIEGLDAHLELQRARRKLGDDFSQRFGQTVRNHLEMEEMAGLITREKEFEDGLCSSRC